MDRKVLIELIGKDKTTQMFKNLNKSFTNIKAGMRQMASFSKYIALGLSGAVYSAIPFGKKMAEVSTMIDTSRYNMKNFRKEIIALSKETGRGPTELAEALRQTISAGVDAGESMSFLRVAVKAAIGGVAETVDAVDLLTNAMNAYGLGAEKAAYVSDIAFGAVKEGKTTMSELAANMGKAFQYSSQLNISLEDLFAALATITKGGVDTTIAVTELRAVMQAVIKPAAEAVLTAKNLGLEFDVAAIRSMGFFNWLGKIKMVVGDNTETMAKLFPNVRGLGAVLDLTGKQAEEFARIQQVLIASTGEMGKAYSKVADSDAVKMEKVINELKIQIIEIGEAVIPVVLDFVRWAKENSGLVKTLAAVLGTMILINKSGIIPLSTGLYTGIKALKAFEVGLTSSGALLSSATGSLAGFEMKLLAIGAAKGVAIAAVAAIGYKIGEFVGEVTGLHDWIAEKLGGEILTGEKGDIQAWKTHLGRAKNTEDVQLIYQSMYRQEAIRMGVSDTAIGNSAPTLNVENISIGNPDELFKELQRQLTPRIRELEQRMASNRQRENANQRIILQGT